MIRYAICFLQSTAGPTLRHSEVGLAWNGTQSDLAVTFVRTRSRITTEGKRRKKFAALWPEPGFIRTHVFYDRPDCTYWTYRSQAPFLAPALPAPRRCCDTDRLGTGFLGDRSACSSVVESGSYRETVCASDKPFGITCPPNRRRHPALQGDLERVPQSGGLCGGVCPRSWRCHFALHGALAGSVACIPIAQVARHPLALVSAASRATEFCSTDRRSGGRRPPHRRPQTSCRARASAGRRFG